MRKGDAHSPQRLRVIAFLRKTP